MDKILEKPDKSARERPKEQLILDGSVNELGIASEDKPKEYRESKLDSYRRINDDSELSRTASHVSGGLRDSNSKE